MTPDPRPAAPLCAMPEPAPQEVDEMADRLLADAARLAMTTPLAKGCDARDYRQRRCLPVSNEATCRSLHGNVCRAVHDLARRRPSSEDRARVLRAAQARVRELLDTVSQARYGRPAADLNDDPKTGRGLVIVLMFAARDLLSAVARRGDET
jgi:hypothetical protein